MADFDNIPIYTTAEKIEKISNMDILTEKVEIENDNALITASALLETLNENSGGDIPNLEDYYTITDIDELLKPKISFWQPNTEYKVGDVVYGIITFDVMGEEVPQSYLFKCIEEHTSSTVSKFTEFPYEIDGDYWDAYPIESRASFDASGNHIETTYATKEELAEAIGQALEGDY